MITPVSSTEQPKFAEFMKVENEKLSKKTDAAELVQGNDLEKQEAAKQVESNTNSVNALFDGDKGNKIRFENREHETIIKIMDKNDELVRQIPPEELMQMKQKMEQLVGNFIDTYT